jgi:hypothetical protein
MPQPLKRSSDDTSTSCSTSHLRMLGERSEHSIREWMGAGMDLDIEVLQLVTSEHFTVARFGQYLRELRALSRRPRIADAGTPHTEMMPLRSCQSSG